jgi:hypothetical protein
MHRPVHRFVCCLGSLCRCVPASPACVCVVSNKTLCAILLCAWTNKESCTPPLRPHGHQPWWFSCNIMVMPFIPTARCHTSGQGQAGCACIRADDAASARRPSDGAFTAKGTVQGQRGSLGCAGALHVVLDFQGACRQGKRVLACQPVPRPPAAGPGVAGVGSCPRNACAGVGPPPAAHWGPLVRAKCSHRPVPPRKDLPPGGSASTDATRQRRVGGPSSWRARLWVQVLVPPQAPQGTLIGADPPGSAVHRVVQPSTFARRR